MKKYSYVHNFEEWEQEFTFFHPVKVRFSETDMFGHLNNTVPFVYFEEARMEFFKSIGLDREWLDKKNEAIPVVADLQCDFLQQVFFDEKLVIGVKVDKLGTSSCDLHYKGVAEDGRVCFIGRGSLVQISSKTGKALPLAGDVKGRLEQAKKSL